MTPLMRFVSLFSLMMLTMNVSIHAQNMPNPLKGKRLYRSYCLVCHGADGTSAGPLADKLGLKPADLASEQYRTQSAKELAAVIEGYGRKQDSQMPNWGEVLSKQDAYDVAAYITKLKREELRYIGDTRRGRVVFKSACIACHGQDGMGKGVLAKLLNVAMVDFTDASRMQDLSDAELIGAIRDGKGHYMVSWKEILDDGEITDVASYVRLLPTLTIGKEASYQPNPLKGSRLYRSYCLVCHGVDGNNAGPLASKLDLKPADLTADNYQSKNVEELTAIIGGYGRKSDSRMPVWGTVLPRTELSDIAAYVTNLNRGDLEYAGDPRRGRAIFKGACIACHGRFGTGNGALAQLIKIPMIDFTEPGKLARLSDQELVLVIREGKGPFMASWKDILDDGEITDVASYLRALSK